MAVHKRQSPFAAVFEFLQPFAKQLPTHKKPNRGDEYVNFSTWSIYRHYHLWQWVYDKLLGSFMEHATKTCFDKRHWRGKRRVLLSGQVLGTAVPVLWRRGAKHVLFASSGRDSGVLALIWSALALVAAWSSTVALVKWHRGASTKSAKQETAFYGRYFPFSVWETCGTSCA
ncbi:hypothetical protein L484_027912 [Morus notabilis]|uniref:Uncharacterized protein n=1 Tax=Morus notabilis TaxID=981085 RepID=W9SVZ8_9ROSA|nr:hypothetical protein L484_027912 [Morus notabilis]